MRILHLIDGGARTAAACPWTPTPGFDQVVGAVRMLGGALSHEQVACVVGTRPAADRAMAQGLALAAAISPIASASPLIALAERRGPFDLVQAWSGRVARLAAPALGGAIRITGPNGVLVAGPGEEPPGGIDPVTWLDVPPAVVVSRPDPARRMAVRDQLGVPPSATAVLLVGNPPQADALRFVFLLSLLRVAGSSAIGVVPAGAAQLARAARFARSAARTRVIASEQPIEDLLAAADVGVFDGGGPGPTTCSPPSPRASAWPIAQAHGAGVPVVAPAWAATDGWYPPSAATACLAHSSALPELARILLPLVDDAAARTALSETLRDAAGRRTGAFCAAVERAWIDCARQRGAPA
jgi:hypothetical protein